LHYRYVSPRRRAQRTLELLEIGCRDKYPWQDSRRYGDEGVRTEATVQVTEDIREWDYGKYEGVTSKQIAKDRKEAGLPQWDIWKDGCPGGEWAAVSRERQIRILTDWTTDLRSKSRNGWTA
jgi:probable phosphoglycerate mutase